MELKRGEAVALWNNRPTFNRTTMELKRCYYGRPRPSWPSFNRTTMELKHGVVLSPSISFAAFNRTTMELKRFLLARVSVTSMLLIEPLWN